LFRDGEDEVGDIAFDFEGLFEVAVLVEDSLVMNGHVSPDSGLLELLVAGVLDAESVRAFGNAFKVESAIASQLSLRDVFLVFGIFDNEVSAVDGVAIACCGDVNRKAEEEFFGSVEAFNGGSVVSSAVNGDVTFSEWEYDITFKGGKRVKMNQVAVRHWKNGKIVSERFYYDKGAH
jgi:hypothetical protein